MTGLILPRLGEPVDFSIKSPTTPRVRDHIEGRVKRVGTDHFVVETAGGNRIYVPGHVYEEAIKSGHVKEVKPSKLNVVREGYF